MATATSKKLTLPKTLGETIDLLFKLREERLAIDRVVDEMKAREKTITDHLLANFDKQSVDGAKGQIATASIKRTETADVTDWPAFWEYIRKNKAYELIQQRASITGLKDRWSNNKVVPGVQSREVISLSLTKASSSNKTTKSVARKGA